MNKAGIGLLLGMWLAIALIGDRGIAAKNGAPGTANLLVNGDFEQRDGNKPVGYLLIGEATYQYLGTPGKDASSWGVAFHSWQADVTGEVVQFLHIPMGKRNYRFSFRGLAQSAFAVAPTGHLRMDVSFWGGADLGYGDKFKELYPIIEEARKDLAVNGDNHVAGAAAWRTYSMEFTVPFDQVNRLRLAVSFEKAAGRGRDGSDFYVDDFELIELESPAESKEPAAHGQVVSLDRLLPIGGRWSYAARKDETTIPAQFDSSNCDRLVYDDGQYETPFAGNMSSWLRAGDRDAKGKIATTDMFIADNVTVRFDKTTMIVHTRDLPNHPTGKFPQRGRGLFGNPNYITEQDETYYIPLDPKERAGHTVTDLQNRNRALNMGPIGVAANGVVFFNPFDADSQDASNFMDACCGHPNQDGMYHYHKYPICMNTPWSDDGEAHSALLGWAFDGYPIYGPYESKGVMARDLKGDNKLNGFNMHYDAKRGWHYHVTPGVFPYIIGGYWGTPDRRNMHPPRRMGGGPPGRGGPRGGQGFGGPPPFGPDNGPPPGPGNFDR